MMSLSQKCQYALRAIFELAKRRGVGPITVGQVAAEQAIPPRFLEVILGELRKAGFVESRRGAQGGYLLRVSPGRLKVGTIIRFIDGPVGPVRCVNAEAETDCPLHGRCAFMEMWTQARDAVEQVFDTTTFEDLIETERQSSAGYTLDYCI